MGRNIQVATASPPSVWVPSLPLPYGGMNVNLLLNGSNRHCLLFLNQNPAKLDPGHILAQLTTDTIGNNFREGSSGLHFTVFSDWVGILGSACTERNPEKVLMSPFCHYFTVDVR